LLARVLQAIEDEAVCCIGQRRRTFPGNKNQVPTSQEANMNTTTLIIIVLLMLIVFGGGGWYGRGRWY
jgi:hypothetical protein